MQIEALTELRKTVGPSDFILMKFNLKLLIGFFPQRESCLDLSFEQPELKKLTDAATTLNDEIVT